jgi:hypothetical protein
MESEQSRRFTNFAHEIGADESEERFDAALKKVAAHKPPGKKETKKGKSDQKS